MPDLYEKMGGDAAVSKIATDVYKHIRKDKLLMPFFKHVDMKEQVKMFRYYLKYTFKGAEEGPNVNLRKAHAHLKIEDKHFNAILSHLISALKAENVDYDLIDEGVDRIFALKDDIMNR